jgi:hypothetical protein
MQSRLRLLCTVLGCAVQAAAAGPSPCADIWDPALPVEDAAFEHVLLVTDDAFSSAEDCRRLGGYFLGRHSPETQISSPRRLDHARLSEIVDRSWEPAAEDPSQRWLTALLDWLKRIGFEQFSRDLAGLIDENLPEAERLKPFFTALLWIIVVATVVLVLREFYLAGLLRLPWRRHVTQTVTAPPLAAFPVMPKLTGLSPRSQLAVLLRYSIAVLVARRELTATGGLTNREYLRALERRHDEAASLLESQLALTEPVIYGNDHASQAQVNACRHLSQQLAGGAGGKTASA